MMNNIYPTSKFAELWTKSIMIDILIPEKD